MSGFAVPGIGSLTSIDRETDWIRKHGGFAKTESKLRRSFGGEGIREFEAAVIRLGSRLVGRSRRAFDHGCAIFVAETERRLRGISPSLPQRTLPVSIRRLSEARMDHAAPVGLFYEAGGASTDRIALSFSAACEVAWAGFRLIRVDRRMETLQISVTKSRCLMPAFARVRSRSGGKRTRSVSLVVRQIAQTPMFSSGSPSGYAWFACASSG